jgi:transcriptional regulator with XRE-family HTH domain
MDDREWQEILGKRLRALREGLGLNRRHVAEQVGVDRYTVFRWEAAERLPSLLHIRKLAKVLRVSAGDLPPPIREFEPEVFIVKRIGGVLKAVAASPEDLPSAPL